jgi:hypothetical protein
MPKAAAAATKKAPPRMKRPTSPESGKLKAERDAFAAEAKFLRLENTELKARLGGIKAKVQARMREIESGVEQRLKAANVPPAQRMGIMGYIKAGFGTMLGALAAIAVVDIVSDAFGEEAEAEAPVVDDVPNIPDDLVDDLFGGAIPSSPRRWYSGVAKPIKSATVDRSKKKLANKSPKRVTFSV